MYIQWFIEHDWTVITVSRPGYGRTSSALAGHNGDFEAALCRLLDDLKIASATVVGISAGDRAAMRFVELYPERVDRLLLVSLVSWPSMPMSIAVHILFNRLVEQATWPLTRWLLRRYPEASLKQLIVPLTTLPAKTLCREYQKSRGRSMCSSLLLYNRNRALSKTCAEKYEQAIRKLDPNNP